MNHYEDVKKSPLFVAREKGRSDIIKLLLNNGAAVNVCGTETNSKKPNKYCLYVGILSKKPSTLSLTIVLATLDGNILLKKIKTIKLRKNQF